MVGEAQPDRIEVRSRASFDERAHAPNQSEDTTESGGDEPGQHGLLTSPFLYHRSTLPRRR